MVVAAGVLGGSLIVPEREVTLKKGAVGIVDSTVIAISSTAPAYSLAASMVAMVAAVGFTSPLVVTIAFVPVLGIAVAYMLLNRANPTCGASFTWVAEDLHPVAGFLSGWAQQAANVLFMVSASSLAGGYSLNMLGQLGWKAAQDHLNDQLWVAAAGSLWFALVTFMVVYGITAAARFQRLLLALEYVIVVAFALYAILKAYSAAPIKGSRHVSLDWFNPTHIGGLSAFAAGALVAVFFYWGWDTAANINEEADNSAETPGRAGVYSMFALLLIFLLGVCALQVTMSAGVIANSPDTLAAFGAILFPNSAVRYLMTLAVLSSTVATLQTTLLPASRVGLAMARERVFPQVFARIHPRFLTPWIGTLILAGLAFLGIAASVKSPSVGTFLTNSVNQVGVMIALYYGLTGLTCTWYFRHVLFRSLKTFVLAGIFAFGGGVFMLFMGGYSVVTTVQNSGWGTEAPVLASLALGIPALAAAWINNPEFFRRPTRAYPRPA